MVRQRGAHHTEKKRRKKKKSLGMFRGQELLHVPLEEKRKWFRKHNAYP